MIKPASFLNNHLFARNGFFAILSLLTILFFISYFVTNYFQQQSDDVSLIFNKKIAQTNILYSVTQKRSLLLTTMFNTIDMFELDELYQKINDQASLFIKAKKKLLDIGLTDEEKIIFLAAQKETQKLSPIIVNTAEYLINDEYLEAIKLWNIQTLAIHVKATRLYQELIQNQQKQIKEQLAAIEAKRFKILSIINFLSITTFIVGLFLSILFSRKIKENNHKITALNASLEAKVHKRTLKLKETNQKLEQEIIKTEESKKKLQYIAHYDSLTKLPNRAFFTKQLKQAFIAAKKQQKSFALLFIDLDRFKIINDTLGHDMGDLLLQQVSNRLRSCIRQGDFIARIGGDEFTIIANNITNKKQIKYLSQRIIDQLSTAYELNNQQIQSGCSVGIAVYPTDAQDPQMLTKKADTAMYYIKETGRNDYAFYQADMSIKMEKELQFIGQLQGAIIENKLINHYQPIFNIKENKITGVEILLRWKDEKLDTSTNQLISSLEKSGDIYSVGLISIDRACIEFQKFYKETGILLNLTFNLTTRQIKNPNFIHDFCEIIESSQYPYHAIEIDITESLLFDDDQSVLDTISKLRNKGILFALDDFSSTVISLQQLQHFPVDTLKLTRSFFKNNQCDPQNVIIIEAIIRLGHSLELNIIAKAVETPKERDYIIQLNCDAYQGNIITPAIGLDELKPFILKSLKNQQKNE